MPELPEVEVLRRSLEPHLVGRRIEALEVRDPRLRLPVDARRLRRDLVSRRIGSVGRRAKYLLIEVEGDRVLVVHLGMSGRLTLERGWRQPRPHEHVLVRLDDDWWLRYRDPRRFGLVMSRRRDALASDPRFATLGVEPLSSADLGAELAGRAKGRRGPVKSFLMNAGIVVGVGNIYASEALHLAGVHPRRSVGRIAAGRWQRIGAAVEEVLKAAIEQGGTTLNDFANANGESGYFQVSLRVYGHEGEACGRCGATIRRIVQSGRSTFYCPRCQR